VSINLAQAFVRYPDARDAADVAAEYQGRNADAPGLIVARAPGGWVAVLAAGDDVPPALAERLSRALEARAFWFGLAGSALAYRARRYELGRVAEEAAEPAELFGGAESFALPAYRDAERVLLDRLRAAELPEEYLYLHEREVGMAGGEPDAARVRGGQVERFSHRVPKRARGGVRTLFDLFEENEQTVTERLELRGTWDEARAEGLLRTLDAITRRREVPPGWTVRYEVSSTDPELPPKLAALHRKRPHPYTVLTK
jgi:hypothetical protein